MALSLKETRAISGLAGVLCEFLPGSGHVEWKNHVNFGAVATKVGVGDFWQGGSKKPAVTQPLAQTFEHRRSAIQKLIEEIVYSGVSYRESKNRPITRVGMDQTNGHILELGIRFPKLWDREYLNSLEQTTAERAREHVNQEEAKQQQQLVRSRRSHELFQIKEQFLGLTGEQDRSKAGFALERLLNRLFDLFGLNPRQPFRVGGTDRRFI